MTLGPRIAVLGLQAGSYLAFAVWAGFAPAHYRRVHRLKVSLWLLRAHAFWLTLVAAGLTPAIVRDRLTAEAAVLGIGSAAALAFNDRYSDQRGEVAPIYRKDLVFELALLAAWMPLLAGERRARPLAPSEEAPNA